MLKTCYNTSEGFNHSFDTNWGGDEVRQQDAELNRLFSQIAIWEDEYNRAKAASDGCRQQMNSEWESLHYLQTRYRQYKEMADEEFRSAKYCWEMNDKASAKEHSIIGRI